MNQKRLALKISIAFLAVAAVFLSIFLSIYLTRSGAEPQKAYSDVVVENLPTDYWTDYAVEPASGTGTSTDPYLISTAEEFAWIQGNSTYSTYIEFTADIDLSAHLWTPISHALTIEGNNFSIIGMKVYETSKRMAGLFTKANSATLRNFILKDALIYLDMDTNTGICYASFLVAYDGTDYGNNFKLNNVSVQDSQMYVKNFSSKVYIGGAMGYSYCAGGTFNGYSSINTTINISSEKSANDYVYVTGICAYFSTYRGGCSVRIHNCAIDNFNVNLDFLSNRSRRVYITGITDYIPSPEKYLLAMNCYFDINANAIGSTSQSIIYKYKPYYSYVLGITSKEDALTEVPEDFERSMWKDADTSSLFPYIYLNNYHFINYYGLNDEFENVEFWKDCAEVPAGTSSSNYKVSTPEQLAYAIGHSGIYYLQNDIDLAGKYWTTAERCTIYGQGHKIKNINIDLDYYECWNETAYNTTMVGFSIFYTSNDALAENLIMEDTVISGSSVKKNISICLVGGYDDSSSDDVVISNVSVERPIVAIKSSQQVNFCGLTYELKNNSASNPQNNIILDADIKISSSQQVNFYAFARSFRYTGTLGKFVFIGDVDIDAYYSYVYLAGTGNVSSNGNGYVFSNCVVGGTIYTHKGETTKGVVYKFGAKHGVNCMEVNLNIVASKIIGADDEDYKNLTTIPSAFPTSIWSQANTNNEKWPYIFPKITKFMNYYGLTYIATEIDTWDKYASTPAGTGAETSPWQIYSANELAYLSSYCTSTYSRTYYVNLQADIDLAQHIWRPIGVSENLKIIFNGNNHTISNLNISQCETKYCGLFGTISSSSTMKNLIIKDAVVCGQSAAALVGYGTGSATNVKVINAEIKASAVAYGLGCSYADYCYVSGVIFGNTYARAVANSCTYSENHATIISLYGPACFGSGTNKWCKNYGDITGAGACYGIGGMAENCINYGEIKNINENPSFNMYVAGIGSSSAKNCINYGNVSAVSNSSYVYIAGISSHTGYSGEIVDCVNYGAISGGYYTAGICAKHDGTSNSAYNTILSCFNFGQVIGSYYAGGLIGYCGGGIVQNSHNYAPVTANENNGYCGGLIGYNYSYVLEISNSSNTGATAGNYAGGLIGYTGATTTISNSSNTGMITGNYAGGIVGSSGTLTINNTDNIGNVVGKTYGGGLIGRGSALTISNCLIYCDVSTDNGTSYSSYAGGVVGEISGTTTMTSVLYQGNISSSATNAGGIFAKVNDAAHVFSQCNITANIVAGDVSSSYCRASAIGYCTGSNLTFSDLYLNVSINNTTQYLDKLGVKQSTISNSFYDIVLKTSEEEATTHKEYILGTDVTEETAFSSDTWYFGNQLNITLPIQKSLLHVGQYLEGESVMDWIKANDYSLAE